MLEIWSLTMIYHYHQYSIRLSDFPDCVVSRCWDQEPEVFWDSPHPIKGSDDHYPSNILMIRVPSKVVTIIILWKGVMMISIIIIILSKVVIIIMKMALITQMTIDKEIRKWNLRYFFNKWNETLWKYSQYLLFQLEGFWVDTDHNLMHALASRSIIIFIIIFILAPSSYSSSYFS